MSPIASREDPAKASSGHVEDNSVAFGVVAPAFRGKRRTIVRKDPSRDPPRRGATRLRLFLLARTRARSIVVARKRRKVISEMLSAERVPIASRKREMRGKSRCEARESSIASRASREILFPDANRVSPIIAAADFPFDLSVRFAGGPGRLGAKSMADRGVRSLLGIIKGAPRARYAPAWKV